MEDDPQGVTEPASPTEAPTDRPLQNVKGEFDRKFGQLSQKMDVVMSHLATLQQPQTASQAPAAGNYGAQSDDALWELAKAGDKAAFDAHQARQAAKVYTSLRSREQHQDLVSGQIQILNSPQKYGKAFADPNHELSQARDAAYTLLQRRGYPAGDATYLEAMKTAIADRPDVVANLFSQSARAREGARRVSAENSGVTGATYRDSEPSQQPKMRVTAPEAALAQRMNIKDPAGAKARFLERRAKGQSNLGAVGGFVNEEDF